MADKDFEINLDYMSAQKATSDFYKNQYLSNKKPLNVSSEGNDEFRIRIGIIDNYLIDRKGTIEDPLDVKNVINMKTGKVVIRWLNYNGGLIRPEDYGYPSSGYPEKWKYIPSKDSKYPEKRTLDCYNHDKASNREILDLSHAFIWANDKNWCGINSLPPVGSRVAIGFLKNNQPVILNYIQTNYTICKPFLKPGETLIKGYGDNYIHFRQSSKLDLHVKSEKGKKDLDDPYNRDIYPNSIEMWQRFDCYTRNLLFDINQKDSNAIYRSTLELKPEMTKLTTKSSTKESFYTITPNDLLLKSNNSKLYLGTEAILQCNNSKITLNNGKANINVNTNIGGILSIPSYSNVTNTLNNILKRLSSLESRMMSAENRIMRLENRMSRAENRISNTENRCSRLENRMANVENRCNNLESRTANLQNTVVNINNSLSSTNNRVNSLYGIVNSLNYTVNYNSNRISWLENKI